MCIDLVHQCCPSSSCCVRKWTCAYTKFVNYVPWFEMLEQQMGEREKNTAIGGHKKKKWMFDLLSMVSCSMKMASGNVTNTNVRDKKEVKIWAELVRLLAKHCIPECEWRLFSFAVSRCSNSLGQQVVSICTALSCAILRIKRKPQ